MSFAVRGKVDAEYLIGVQYFDDPDLRLLAYFQEAKDSDLHIYSSPESLYCSSDGPRVPASYSKEMLATAPYELKAGQQLRASGGRHRADDQLAFGQDQHLRLPGMRR